MKKIITLIVVAALASVGYFGFQKRQAGKVAAEQAAAQALANKSTPTIEFAPTDIVLAGTAAISRAIPVTGSLKPVNQSLVKAKVAGDLKELSVREGMTVTAGQVVGVVDSSEYVAKLNEREAQLRSAVAQVEQAQRNLSSNKALLEKNFISQSAFDTTKSSLDIAVANKDAIAAQVAQSRKTLADTRLTSPISGMVSERFAQVGEKLSADNRILSIVDLSKMEIEAAVPSSDVGSVSIGQTVALQVEGIDDKLSGTIARISPATQAGSRSILVYIGIDNSGPKRNPKLRSGLFAQGSLSLETRQGVLVVPQAALRDAAGRNFVYVIDAGKIIARDVQVGLRDDAAQAANGNMGVVEIISGLKSGEQVVGVNLGPLPVGATVTLAKKKA